MDPPNDWAQERDGNKGLFDENDVARFGSSVNLFNLRLGSLQGFD